MKLNGSRRSIVAAAKGQKPKTINKGG